MRIECFRRMDSAARAIIHPSIKLQPRSVLKKEKKYDDTLSTLLALRYLHKVYEEAGREGETISGDLRSRDASTATNISSV